ncbi:MAG: 50S ribosomal protein L23 [bacterium]|nr:50S ribosomal protein L23 [bacterium]
MTQAKPLHTLAKVLIAPLSSEKATRSGERENSVVFWVNPKANKLEIKQAVEAFFAPVKVKSVRTMVKGRSKVRFGQTNGRTKKKKKAYVLLAEGSQINFAELE